MRLQPSEMLFSEDAIRTTLTQEARPLVHALVKLLTELEGGRSYDVQTYPSLPVFYCYGQFWARDNLWLFILKQFQESTNLMNVDFPVCTVEVPRGFSPPVVHGGKQVNVIEGPVLWEDLRHDALSGNATVSAVSGHGFDVRQRLGVTNPNTESEEASFSGAEESNGDTTQPRPNHQLIDNSAFEAFCVKAGVLYVFVIIVMVLIVN